MLMSRTEKVIAAVVFVPIMVAALLFWRVRAGVCQSETLQTISNLNGIKVETVYTDCDAIAKSDRVDVFLSDANPTVWSRVLGSHRKAVFSYEPSSYREASPDVRVVGPKLVRIYVGRVTSIRKRLAAWRDISIESGAGQIEYP